MSTLKVNNITDTSGGSSNLEVPGAAKAWVNFNGSGTVAIRDSFNVSSVADEGTGDYQVNMTNALGNTNYAVVSNIMFNAGTYIALNALSDRDNTTRTTSAFEIYCSNVNSNAATDGQEIHVIVHGD
tara:strand:+ start:1067 stop:1447 length:381 start_codon:yes stop_codon:yes gene_type:complete